MLRRKYDTLDSAQKADLEGAEKVAGLEVMGAAASSDAAD